MLSLEQIKKEWKELGYEWKEDEHYIRLESSSTPKELGICLKDRSLYIYYGEHYFLFPSTITTKEHELLTKTFRILGWYDD